MNYAEEVREKLSAELPGCDERLLDLYTLLVFVKGREVVLEDVHDAWSLWRTRTRPDHLSIIPFDELDVAVQERDGKYADAIARVAASLRI